ncbi:MAG: hypothetical protein Ct9H300mP11_05420 [Chloroflexota bacterium]|nr:MAG: hypothetical protein Ct9H300mP11_05420 [Chloroflexota bacterium]
MGRADISFNPFFLDSPGGIGIRPLGADPLEPIGKPEKDETTKIRASVFLQQAKKTGLSGNDGIHYWG